MWSCIEDRVETGRLFGRVIRKVVFQDLYADRTTLLSKKPIPKHTISQLKTGDKIAFYDKSEIREGNFLCSSIAKKLTPKELLAEVLSTEEEVRAFCDGQNINTKDEHIFTLVIEAFLTLTRQMNDQESFCNTTNQGPSNQGLPPVPQVVESRSPETPKKDQTKQRKIRIETPSSGRNKPPGVNEMSRRLLEQAELMAMENRLAQSTGNSSYRYSRSDIRSEDNPVLPQPIIIEFDSSPPVVTPMSPSEISPSERSQRTMRSPFEPSDILEIDVDVKHEVLDEPEIMNIETIEEIPYTAYTGEVDNTICSTVVTPSHPDTSWTLSSMSMAAGSSPQKSSPPKTAVATGRSSVKRKPLLMKTKLEILEEYKHGAKLSDIARRRNLNASTVHYIINQGRKKVEWNHMLMQKYNYVSSSSQLQSIDENDYESLRLKARQMEKSSSTSSINYNFGAESPTGTSLSGLLTGNPTMAEVLSKAICTSQSTFNIPPERKPS